MLRPLQPLTLPENQLVRLTLEEQTPPATSTMPILPVNNRAKELEWLATESGPYAGQWVALDGNRLASHGNELAVVSAAARHVHSYLAQDASITLPVLLRSGNRSVDLIASLDTVASSCLFENGYAAELGLDQASGVPTSFRTANSSFNAYGHEVQIEVLGVAVHSLIYFFAAQTIRKNVLGRRGWLDRLRIALVDYDRALYLDTYE